MRRSLWAAVAGGSIGLENTWEPVDLRIPRAQFGELVL